MKASHALFLFMTFFVLKMIGAVSWPWLWVFAPVFIFLGVILVLIILIILCNWMVHLL